MLWLQQLELSRVVKVQALLLALEVLSVVHQSLCGVQAQRHDGAE